MTQDEIIEMARQAGAHDNGYEVRFVEPKYLERFAKLVAAKFDPKIAIADAYRAGVDSGIAAEREACAKVCDALRDCEENTEDYRNGAGWCGEAIRARGQQ
jgi:hypothetical protein